MPLIPNIAHKQYFTQNLEQHEQVLFKHEVQITSNLKITFKKMCVQEVIGKSVKQAAFLPLYTAPDGYGLQVL